MHEENFSLTNEWLVLYVGFYCHCCYCCCCERIIFPRIMETVFFYWQHGLSLPRLVWKLCSSFKSLTARELWNFSISWPLKLPDQRTDYLYISKLNFWNVWMLNRSSGLSTLLTSRREFFVLKNKLCSLPAKFIDCRAAETSITWRYERPINMLFKPLWQLLEVLSIKRGLVPSTFHMMLVRYRKVFRIVNLT